MGKSVKSQYSRITKKDAQKNQKAWVSFECVQNPRLISFEELYYICRWIGECEDEKYNQYFHEGAKMVERFLHEAVLGCKTYEELFKEFKFLEPARMRDPSQGNLFANRDFEQEKEMVKRHQP